MKLIILLIAALAVSACTSNGPAKFAAPDKDAPTWDLNVGKWPGTNDLVHEPQLGMR